MNTVPIFARFVSYDYDAFAASNVPIVRESEHDELLSSLEQTAIVKAAGNDYTLSDPVWCRNDNGYIQLRACIILKFQDENYVSKYVYSNIIQ